MSLACKRYEIRRETAPCKVFQACQGRFTGIIRIDEKSLLLPLKAGRITGGTAGNEVFYRQSLPGLAGICSGETSRSMQHSTSTGR